MSLFWVLIDILIIFSDFSLMLATFILAHTDNKQLFNVSIYTKPYLQIYFTSGYVFACSSMVFINCSKIQELSLRHLVVHLEKLEFSFSRK
jgi:hypothetical protein